MQLGTKGRYAVIAVLRLYDALKHQHVVPLSYISEAEEISITYLEQLFTKLRKAGIVNSVRGQAGGYVLAKNAAFIHLAEIIMAAEENLKFTRCNPHASSGCVKTGSMCKTHRLWEELTNQVNHFLSSISLEDLASGKIPNAMPMFNTSQRQVAND
jgi:Rrf2 family transcriptional regulator, iron-sulfur cluster assembly transcription factor